MKIRLQLSKPTNEEYLLIGISSSLKDYELSYYLNKNFQIFFIKKPDIPFYNKKGLIDHFAFFHHYSEDLRMDYYLFANKSNSAFAIPKYKHFEYFILFKLSYFSIPIEDILKELRQINGINAAIQIPLEKFKDLQTILDDIEMHLLETSSTKQQKDQQQWLW
jgi:hypothetical protein